MEIYTRGLHYEEVEKLPCTGCMTETKHVVLSVVVKLIKGTREEPKGVVEYKTVRCAGCDRVSFCEQLMAREEPIGDPDLDEIYDESWEILHRQLFPARKITRSFIPKGSKSIPKRIKSIHQESIAAFDNDLPVLASAGIRAVLEAVCEDKVPSSKTLYGKINDLVEEGHITKDSGKILHSLRFMGNTAMHQIKPPGDYQINSAIIVVENLLQNVYVIPETAKLLPKHGEADDDGG